MYEISIRDLHETSSITVTNGDIKINRLPQSHVEH